MPRRRTAINAGGLGALGPASRNEVAHVSVHLVTQRTLAIMARSAAVGGPVLAALLPAAAVPTVAAQAAQAAQFATGAVHASARAALREPLAAGSFHPAIQLGLPSNSASPPAAWLLTDSCPGQGSCTAGGYYYDQHGGGRALVVAQRRGTWRRAVAPLRFPLDASAKPSDTIESIVCASPGSCVAVGGYGLNSGGSNPFAPYAATEVRGHWQRALRIRVPTNVGTTDFQASLSGVACTSRGNCVAFGTYFTNAGIHQLMVATETSGRWARARAISAPSDQAAFGYTQATGVQCARPGTCVAIGMYGTPPARSSRCRSARRTATSTARPASAYRPARSPATPRPTPCRRCRAPGPGSAPPSGATPPPLARPGRWP